MNQFYVSKHAGTKGIVVVNGVLEEDDGEVITEDGKSFLLGRGCFDNLDAARLDAIKRTRKKVSLLVKKEEKLEAQIGVWESELPT